MTPAISALTSIRFPAPPVESGNSIGFRCAVDAIPADEVLAQLPDDEAGAEVAEETSGVAAEEVTDEVTEEVTDEVTEEVAEEAGEEVTEEVAEETTEEAVAETETEESEVTDAPVSINCDLRPGVDNGSTYIVGACDWLEKIANQIRSFLSRAAGGQSPNQRS